MTWYLISFLLLAISVLLTLRIARNLLAALNIALAFNLLTYLGAISAFQADPDQGILVFYVALGILCVAVGALVARVTFRYRPIKELHAFRAQQVKSVFASDRTFTLALIGFLLMGISMVLLLFIRGGIPLLSQEVFIAKVQTAQEGGYLNVRFMRLFLPLLIIICLVGYDRIRLRFRKSLIAFVIFFLLGSFALFGYRSYVLNYFTFPMVLLLGYRNVSNRLLMRLGSIAAVAILAITAIAYREPDLLAVLKIILDRVTSDLVSGGLGVVVNTLVPHAGYLYGESFWMDIPAALSRVGIGGRGLENSAQYVVTIAQGSNPYGWQAAPTLIGEAYANFGVGGIIVLTALFGFVLEWLHIATARGVKDTFLFPLKLYAQHAMIIAFGSPFVFSLFDTTMSLAIFCAIFLGLYMGAGVLTGHAGFRRIRRQRGNQMRSDIPVAGNSLSTA